MLVNYRSTLSFALAVCSSLLLVACGTTGTEPAASSNSSLTPTVGDSSSESSSATRERKKYISVSKAYRGSLVKKRRTAPVSSSPKQRTVTTPVAVSATTSRKGKSSKTPTTPPSGVVVSNKSPSKQATKKSVTADLQQIAQQAYMAGNLTKALDYYQRTMRRSPTSGEARYNVGAVYLAAKSYSKAIRSFTDALEFGFTEPEVYHNLGLSYLALGKTAAARKVWSTARKKKIRSAEIETSLGLEALDSGKPNVAAEYFKRAVTYDSDYPEGHNGLATIQLKKGNLKAAMRHWKDAEEAERSVRNTSSGGFAVRSFQGDSNADQSLGILLGPDTDKISERLQGALQLVDEKKFDEALSLLEQLEGSEKGNPSYWSLVGYAQAERGQFVKAEEAWRRSLDIGSTDITSYLNLAVLELGKQNLDEAMALSESALTIDPGNDVANAIQGDVAFAKGKFSSAERSYAQAISTNPNLIPALNNFGLLRVKQKRYDEGLQLLQKGALQSGGDPTVRYNLSLSQILAGDIKEARRNLVRLKEQTPNDPGVYLHLGYVVGTLGQFKEAESYFLKANKLDPESALALNNLGVVSQKTGNPTKARRYYERATDIEPRFAEAYNNLGSVHLELKNRKLARENYEKAVAISAVDHESRRNLGHLFLVENNPGKAVQHLQLALAMKPRDLDTLFDLGLAYRHLGKVAESITFFETFLEFAEKDGSRAQQIIQAERALQRLRSP